MVESVLFAAHQVERGSNGGMESATQIFEALSSDYRWTLLTNRESDRTERWRAKGARILYFSFDQDSGAIKRSMQLFAAGLRTLRLHADILHANDIRAAQTLLIPAQLKRTPLILSVRDTKPNDQRYGAHWHRVGRRLNALITLSNDMAQRLGDSLPVPLERRHTVNSIVDLGKFRPLSANERNAARFRLGISAEEFALTMVAGVFEKKRQLDVIQQVMPHLQELPIRLHLVGDFDPDNDPYAKACLKAVENHNLTKAVTFHGFRTDVSNWLAAADTVLIASEREGLARSMIEAMACGTAVVSFDVCSAHEMLTKSQAGMVCKTGDWSNLTKSIRNLYNHRAEREEMGRRGRLLAEKKFLDKVAIEAWRGIYNSVSR